MILGANGLLRNNTEGAWRRPVLRDRTVFLPALILDPLCVSRSCDDCMD